VRLQLGAVATSEPTIPETQSWRVVHSPELRKIYWIAVVAGLAILGALCVALSSWSWVVANSAGMATSGEATRPWLVAGIALVAFVPLHEGIHLLGQPQWGMSQRSVVSIWPAKLRFGVYYEGCMPRRRWLQMRLAPLAVLSVLPALVVALLELGGGAADVQVGLQVMMVVNALGSGADVVAAILVLRQVPAKADMCFQSGRAYWRPA